MMSVFKDSSLNNTVLQLSILDCDNLEAITLIFWLYSTSVHVIK